MHEVLVNHLGGLSLPRKSVVRLTDRPDMTLDVYRGRKTTMLQQQPSIFPNQAFILFMHLIKYLGNLYILRETNKHLCQYTTFKGLNLG